MSFGFGVGDFIAVITLANNIRKDFVGAPSQFSCISDVLRSFSIVLQDAEVIIHEQELNPREEANLKDVLDGCQEILTKLARTVDKYTELGSRQTDIRGKLKRVWKRLSYEPEDIRELRSGIDTNITLLTALTVRLARDNTFKLVRYQEDKEQQAILDWLTKVDYAPQQSDFFKQRQAGTGQWFLGSEKFKGWVETSKKTLFCAGIPGAGKTVLTAIVVDELSTRFQYDSTVAVAYIYCNYKRQNEQTSEDLLASILKQIAQGRSSLPESVKSLYDRFKAKRTRPAVDDILRVLQSVVAAYSRVFIIVDAIDECQVEGGHRASLLANLSDLQTKWGTSVFITSRFIPEIVKEFGRDELLEIRADEQDVWRYIDGHISHLPSFVRSNPDLQQEIKSAIVKAVDGMFLLAQLHLNSLIGKKSVKAVRAALKNLATGSRAYDHAYDDAMKRIEGQLSDQEELAKQVLSWVTCAKRPLTTVELQHALAVEDGEAELDEDNIPQIEDMISCCAGLVTVDEESRIIRLVHYTAQDYFERTQKEWFPTAEADITTICLTYLSFSVFGSGFCYTDSSFEERLELNPLYDYATHYWGVHTRAALSLNERTMDFLACEAKVEAATQAMLAHSKGPWHTYYSQNVPRHMTGLHLAAYFGVTELVEILLQSANVESKDTWGQTPLLLAARNGHEAVIKQLLEAKADVKSKDCNGETPLWLAADNGHGAVVKQLLEAKADVESKDDICGQTPLSLVAQKGHEAVVKQLLEAKADIESRDNGGHTPLWLAAKSGHEAVVKQLIEAKADVESKDDILCQTPLLWAARYGHKAVVKRLIEAKADVESKDHVWGRTPLLWAASYGHKAVVKQLIEGKADVESKDDVWVRTPLLWAARYGHEAVIKQLLEAKADIESKDDDGHTPLWLAANNGHEAVVKRLIEAKADVESKDDLGRTPLLRAALSGHEAVVKRLLEAKADVESEDDDGQTPLLCAIRNGHQAVVKQLLDAKAELE